MMQKFTFWGVWRVRWFQQWHLNFWPENLFHFSFTLQDSKIFRGISYENPAFLWLLDFKNSEARIVLPQFANYSDWCVEFWVNTGLGILQTQVQSRVPTTQRRMHFCRLLSWLQLVIEWLCPDLHSCYFQASVSGLLSFLKSVKLYKVSLCSKNIGILLLFIL